MRRALIAAALAAATIIVPATAAGAAGPAGLTGLTGTAGDSGACAEAFASPDVTLSRRTPLWGDQADNGNGTFTVTAEVLRNDGPRTAPGPAVLIGCAFADDNGNGAPDPGEARFGSRQAVVFEQSSRNEQATTTAITVAAPAHTRICDRVAARSTDRSGGVVTGYSAVTCRTLGSLALPTGDLLRGLLVAAGVAGLFGWWQRRSSGLLVR